MSDADFTFKVEFGLRFNSWYVCVNGGRERDVDAAEVLRWAEMVGGDAPARVRDTIREKAIEAERAEAGARERAQDAADRVGKAAAGAEKARMLRDELAPPDSRPRVT